MTDGKNNGKLFKIIMALASALFTIIVIISIPTMAAQIWTNDRLSRIRDENLDSRVDQETKEIRQCISDKFEVILQRQSETLQRLVKIEAKIE